MNLNQSIRQILLACATAAFAASSLAAVGIQNPPPGPGMVPDYFGVTGNYANSPQPVLATITITDSAGTGAVAAASTYDYNSLNPGAYTGGITDVKILKGGSSYSADTVVTINGGVGAGKSDGHDGIIPLTVTPIIVNGVIVAISEFTPFELDANGLPTTQPNAKYIGNLSTPLTHLGTGFTVPMTGTGLKKFVDLLPGIPGVSSYASASNGYHATTGANNLGQSLPLAIADTTTFPGSDYYEIAETEYTQQLHTGLPATHLRGYKQLNVPAGSPSASNQYLGPIIIAQKDRPVRVKLVNQLSTGAAGKLQLPVDHTYMGATGGTDTDNRTALHLHGGNTPWISDGLPREWIKPAGETGPNKGVSATNVPDMYFVAGAVVSACSATVTANCSLPSGQVQAKLPSGATTDPGNGALTYFFTNEQSARMMFYHDHAEGITRLNVYDGMAAGYLIQDPTEQAMVTGGTVVTGTGTNTVTSTYVAGTLPPIQDTIPLVIQEKTFVPDNTKPVLNFYGPFASQLNSSDPTWNWGSGVAATGANGNGDLWVPHVYMPNQNPGDVSGANSFGRWDYGPWFWPPFTGIVHDAVANPYYDPACISSVDNYCEGPTIPGTPNGNSYTANTLPAGYDKTLLTLGQPTGTPEAFNDTPLVNGTAYPVLKVDPKQYRLRILSVGNDRILNLALVVAASNRTPNTAEQTAAPAQNTTVLCDGTTEVDRTLCTEARMVPFNKTQHAISKFPDWWYTPQKGGVTFDGRPSGVFDPKTRGPAMVQIGTDGGFLSSPVVIKNQPVNFEYNLKNIVVTNVKEHALLLGPAERADVVVDFTNFAGATLLMYNDSPAPMPAFDLRLDYFTGNYDNTDTGGAFSTLPGYGPNTRTIMQIQVSSDTSKGGKIAASTHQDDIGTIDLNSLTTAVQTAFRTSQEPIIVPQAAYNATYNAGVADSTITSNTNHNLALIQDYALNFTPYTSPATSGDVTAPVLMDMQPKTIIEDWTREYGRMNALLGVELPKTSATINTALPLAYIDPPTELVKISPNDDSAVGANPLTDGTQLWRITHNGVDSHAMHFHLFHVQIVNRVGWDGTIRQTEPNELGWKDTVRMNPLEDVVVALRPRVMKALPFKMPNSHHALDPSRAKGSTNDFFNLDPMTGNASTVNNVDTNYGWEYIWHCHILGHEENDMMRSIAVAQTPEAPSAVTAAPVNGGINVSWKDNSVISNWVTIQRALDSAFTKGLTTLNVAEAECALQTGCARSYIDKSAVTQQQTVYYRVMSNNTVGSGDTHNILPATLLPAAGTGRGTPPTAGLSGYDNVTTESGFSGTTANVLMLSPNVLAFGKVQLLSASAAQEVTVTNTTNANLPFTAPTFCTTASGSCTSTGAPAMYSVTHNCGNTVVKGSSCILSVKLTPTGTAAANGTARNAFLRATGFGTVSLSGTAVNPAATALSATTAFGNVQVGSTSTAQTVTLTNTGVGPLSYSRATLDGTNPTNYVLGANTCVSPLAVGARCTIQVSAKPSTIGARPATLVIVDGAGTQNVALTATGVVPTPSLGTGVYSFGTVTGVKTNTFTLSNTGTSAAPYVIGSITVAKTGTGPGAYSVFGGTCAANQTLAVGRTCTVIVQFVPSTNNTTKGITSATLTVTGTGVGVATTYTATRGMTGTF